MGVGQQLYAIGHLDADDIWTWLGRISDDFCEFGTSWKAANGSNLISSAWTDPRRFAESCWAAAGTAARSASPAIGAPGIK
jgi:hypothetical protein